MTEVVRARALSHRYPDGHTALDGLDLTVERDERVAVLGPNGAGKTTLMLHLNGLLERTGGDLAISGMAVERRTMRAIRAHVGLVFQDPDDQLFMPTVGEDVAFGPRNAGLDPTAARAAAMAALAEVRMAWAWSRAPHHLSAGERRRVAVATVLAMRPGLLVLDEPSANLDPRSRRELLEVLERLPGTMLVVTHDLPLAAELCERCVILSGGRIVAEGPTRELLADARLLAAHDLELPAGLDLGRVPPRGRPAAVRA